MPTKLNSGVIPFDKGDTFWQPGVKGNSVTIKISSWNFINPISTVFYNELPSGGVIPEHAHQHEEEILICLDGEGLLTIDGIDHTFKQYDVAYFAPLSKHVIRSVGFKSLKMMVVISPGGLEERLKLMGIAKKDDEEPPDAFDSVVGKQNSHGVV